jgi:hypothetical protein
MPGRKELRSIRLKSENTNGTPTSPRFLWRGNGDLIDDKREVKRAEEQVGIFGGTDRTYIPKIMAELALASTEATFEQLSDMFLMVGCGTTGGGGRAGSAQGASGSTALFLLAVPSFTAPVTYSYTAEAGNGTAGNDGWTEVIEYLTADEVKLSFKGGEAMMVSANLTGRQGTPTNQSGTFSLVGTVPAVETILASAGSFWLAPSGSGFGTQQVTPGNILAGEVTFKSRWARKWTVDSGLRVFHTAVFAGIDITGQLTLEGQSSGTYGAYGSAGQVEKWRGQIAQMLTATWRGGAITEGTTYVNKELTLQLPIKWESFDKVGDLDGNDIRVGKFFSAYNPEAPAAGRGTIIIARLGTSEFAGA